MAIVIRRTMSEDLAHCAVESSQARASLETVVSDETKGGRQSNEPVSADVNVAPRCGIGLSARFPFKIACKDKDSSLGIDRFSGQPSWWSFKCSGSCPSRQSYNLSTKAPSFEMLDCVDCRAAPPSAGMSRVNLTSCNDLTWRMSNACAKQLVMI